VKIGTVEIPDKVALIGGGVVLLLVAPKLLGWLAGQTAKAAGNVAVGVATGTVYAVSEAVGIPDTDVTKCQAAVNAGKWLDASFYCPAGTFFKDAAGAIFTPSTGQQVAQGAAGSPAIVTIAPAADGAASDFATQYPGGA